VHILQGTSAEDHHKAKIVFLNSKSDDFDVFSITGYFGWGYPWK